MLLTGYIAAILMGLILGVVGGGGSILTVPILVYLFQIDPILATGYSLFIVGLTSFVGGISYLIRKQVDLKTGFLFAVPSFLGVYAVRAFLMPALPDVILTIGDFQLSKSVLIMVTFSILMILSSFSMIKTKKESLSKIDLNKTSDLSIQMPETSTVLSQRSTTSNQMFFTPQFATPLSNWWLIGLEGLIVGGITGFVGAGGGFLIIPALVLLTGMQMKVAVGTSLFIIAAKSLIGFLGDVQNQNTTIDWSFLLSLSALAIVGLFVGMLVSNKISETFLKKSFGYFILLSGILILISSL